MFCDPTDADNLISGPSSFSESSLYIWKFSGYVLLKASLENVEHYLASMWNEGNCVVVWTFLGTVFFGIGKKTDLFQFCGHCWVSLICWHIECKTLTASSFRIWNSSAGIPWPPLALSEWCFLSPTWFHTPKGLVLGEWWHHHGYLSH